MPDELGGASRGALLIGSMMSLALAADVGLRRENSIVSQIIYNIYSPQDPYSGLNVVLFAFGYPIASMLIGATVGHYSGKIKNYIKTGRDSRKKSVREVFDRTTHSKPFSELTKSLKLIPYV